MEYAVAYWRGIYVKRDYLADYRTWAQSGNENLLNGVPTTEVADQHAAYILEHFPPPSGGGEKARVLDVGCGSMTLLRKFAASGTDAELIGTLPSKEEVHVANELLSSGGLQERISIRRSTLTALEFDDNLFDAVYVNEALHYIQADEATTALNELKRVIRPGGSLFVGSFPDHDEHALARESLGPWTHLRRRLRDGEMPYSKFKLILLTLRYIATGKAYVIWQSTPLYATPENFSFMLGECGFVVSHVENPRGGRRWNYLAHVR